MDKTLDFPAKNSSLHSLTALSNLVFFPGDFYGYVVRL